MRGCLIRPDIGRQHSEAIREIDIQIHLEERLLLVSALSQGEGQSKPYRTTPSVWPQTLISTDGTSAIPMWTVSWQDNPEYVWLRLMTPLLSAPR